MGFFQYGDHVSTLEQKIKLVQEKAEIDSTSWYGGDDDQNQEVDSIHVFLQKEVQENSFCLGTKWKIVSMYCYCNLRLGI